MVSSCLFSLFYCSRVYFQSSEIFCSVCCYSWMFVSFCSFISTCKDFSCSSVHSFWISRLSAADLRNRVAPSCNIFCKKSRQISCLLTILGPCSSKNWQKSLISLSQSQQDLYSPSLSFPSMDWNSLWMKFWAQFLDSFSFMNFN